MRSLTSILVLVLLTFSTAGFAERRGAGQGQGIQQQKRIHTPGTGWTGQTPIHQRDRKRDGTGVNCPGTCPQSGTQTQTQSEKQTQTRTRTETQSKTGPQ